MPEDSVKFSISVEESVDDSKLEEIKNKLKAEILEEIRGGLEDIPKVTTPPKPKRPGRKRPDAPKTPEGGRSVSGSGLISEYGYGHEPKKHYVSQRRRRRILPETGEAPFGTDTGVIPGFGGSAYVAPRGFQQSKVSRRGSTRYSGAGPAFPGIESFLDRINRLDSQLQDTRHTTNAIQRVVSDWGGTLLRGGAILANPSGFVGGEVLSLLRGGGPYGALIATAIGTIVATPAVVSQIIKTLSVKGGPLNRDWKRNFEEETNELFGIPEKKRRLIGQDAFLVTQTRTYEPESGSTTYNSLENRDEIILKKAGLAEKAFGVEY